jgi:nicotinamidase-related amidase
MYEFTLRTQKLETHNGYNDWVVHEEQARVDPAKMAVIICDMWDRHWSTGATVRGGRIAPAVNRAVSRARERGALIIHAPSECDAFYAGHPARERFLAVPRPEHIPHAVELKDWAHPIDSSGGGSDTTAIDEYPPNTLVWKRQNEQIVIDEARDLVSCDDGDRVFAHLEARGIDFIVFMGVHTNMCVLYRSFGILNMRRYGKQTVLARDLTDAMYDPALPPYVSHADGTRLITEYIEKFYCPTIGSDAL